MFDSSVFFLQGWIHKEKYILLLIHEYVHVSVVSEEARRGHQIPRAGDIGCELPSFGAGNKHGSSKRSENALQPQIFCYTVI